MSRRKRDGFAHWAPAEGSRAGVKTAPGALHEGQPWREVVFIETQTGKRGGETWVLTLSCGHRAFRPVPRPRMDIMQELVTTKRSGALRHQPRTAPHRVRCLFCPKETT